MLSALNTQFRFVTDTFAPNIVGDYITATYLNRANRKLHNENQNAKAKDL